MCVRASIVRVCVCVCVQYGDVDCMTLQLVNTVNAKLRVDEVRCNVCMATFKHAWGLHACQTCIIIMHTSIDAWCARATYRLGMPGSQHMHKLHCASSAGQVISAKRVCMATLPRLIGIHCETLSVSSGVRFIHVAWHACCACSAWPVAHVCSPRRPDAATICTCGPTRSFFQRCGQCFTSRAARPVAHMQLRDHHARAVSWSHTRALIFSYWVHTRRAIYTPNAPSHRSDWHGWKGHDGDIAAFGIEGGFTPGHELSGVVHEVGEGVTRCVRPACLHSFWPIFIAR
jgi:hypothetical protein